MGSEMCIRDREHTNRITPYYYIYRLLLPKSLTIRALRVFPLSKEKVLARSLLAFLGCDVQKVICFAERSPSSIGYSVSR